MKIVIFIDWFAPAYKAGGPIQSIVNLVSSNLQDVHYKIICSNKDLDGQFLQGVKYDEWVDYNTYTTVWYNSNNKNLPRLIRCVNAWNPDIYFINGVYSIYYNFLPVIIGKASKKIISARGMLHAGALTQKSFKKKIYLLVWKLLQIHKKNLFHATNEDEKNYIESVFGKKIKVHVAPNLPRDLQVIKISSKAIITLQMLSIGLISPMKNYLMVIKALCKCRENIHYTIYGPIKDRDYWQECVEEMKQLPSNITIEYKGDLPTAKVPKALEKAHVFILPSKSENFGHAIFEALTSGKPVITSYFTPWNNLVEAKAGLNVSIENDYELSNAISFFARAGISELENWSNGASLYAKKAINIEQIKEQYLEMFSK